MGRKEFVRVPIENLATAVRVERTRIKCGNTADPAFFREDAVPESLHTLADAGNGPKASDDGASFHL